jgi:Tol biopolymer transport system component
MDRAGEVQGTLARQFEAITTIAWSPDGGAIAFGGATHRADQEVGVFILDRTTGAVTRLGALSFEADLFWSPDGKYLAFAGEGNPSYLDVLYVASRGGKHVRAITRLNSGDSSGELVLGAPSWAPDSRSLAINTFGPKAYEIDSDGAFEIDIYSVRGVRRRRITFTPRPFFLIYNVAWQPSVRG